MIGGPGQGAVGGRFRKDQNVACSACNLFDKILVPFVPPHGHWTNNITLNDYPELHRIRHRRDAHPTVARRRLSDVRLRKYNTDDDQNQARTTHTVNGLRPPSAY